MILNGIIFNFSEIFANYLATEGMSQAYFSKATGIDKSQISKWVNGKHEPHESTLKEIDNKLRNDNIVVNFIDGLLSHVPKRGSATASRENENFSYEAETKDPRDRIPIYNITAKGGVPYLVNTLDDVQIIDYFSIPGFRDCIGSVQVAGDSMSGFVEDGEYIAIKPASFEGIVWGTAYFIIFGGDVAQEPVVKYIREGENGELILRSHNYQYYPDMRMKKSQILSIFTVKGIFKAKRVR